LQAFFNPEFAEQPENSEAVNRLKALFLDQVNAESDLGIQIITSKIIFYPAL